MRRRCVGTGLLALTLVGLGSGGCEQHDPCCTPERGDAGPYCGDGIVSGDEQCDGTPDHTDCTGFGYVGGQVSCNAHCQFDFHTCTRPLCGNDITEPTEECDGADTPTDCADIAGFIGGELRCHSDCSLDYRSCQPDPIVCPSFMEQYTRCSVDVVQICIEGEWTTLEACTGSQSCTEPGFGVAFCEAGPTDPPIGECDPADPRPCDAGMECVAFPELGDWCMTDCSSGEDPCDPQAAYCESDFFELAATGDPASVCMEIAPPHGVCLSDDRGCPDPQVCIAASAAFPLDADLSYASRACRTPCPFDDIGTTSVCGSLECLTDGASSPESWDVPSGDPCALGANVCETKLGPSYGCMDDVPGYPGPVCARPLGFCGLPAPIQTHPTTTVLPAESRCQTPRVAGPPTDPSIAPQLCPPASSVGAFHDAAQPDASTSCVFAGRYEWAYDPCDLDVDCVSGNCTAEGKCGCASDAECPAGGACAPTGQCARSCTTADACRAIGAVCVDGLCGFPTGACVIPCESTDGRIAYECPNGLGCKTHSVDETGFDPRSDGPNGRPDPAAFGAVFEVAPSTDTPLHCPRGSECGPGFECNVWRLPSLAAPTRLCARPRRLCLE